ncbi:osmoprotectant NAGGN system M42 family peptidase [Limibaculum sp. M0105]|uniref:Osmoprotectant NAGGN system M42 family peptidase n=1 Tax=Thermohalobaculum xanthum TaxID=2753746 RepID=A0A8J7SEY3_9RHOB|nr:osmoprotectant NAGGN system M42 family peptidase [Thermohalobaculum xanthum]MBK0399796.1 osmoprotectant NAGGN system M42 family peptidase [Thermohalobaculum xanthum]
MGRLAIDTDYIAEQLKRLLEIPSPTGFTDAVTHAVSEELDRLGAPFEITRRGAIRVRLAGRSAQPARAMISHLDTLGAQIRAIKDSGRLELVPIGHWSARFAEGARATVFSENGTYRGTILPRLASGHAYGDAVDTAPIGWDEVELRVDALARSRPEVTRLGIEIGDFVGIDPQPEFLDNGFIVSRHLDDKAGVAVMLAALKAMLDAGVVPTVDTSWLFSVSEEVGHGASHILTQDIASLIVVDNGASAAVQNSAEFGVTIGMADMNGPFDYHTTRKLIELCRENEIRFQRDVFRFYRSDSASAIEAGADVRTALATFGIDASHGYERIHMHALRSLAELLTAYATSPVDIQRDAQELGPISGFPEQETGEADQRLGPDSGLPRRG